MAVNSADVVQQLRGRMKFYHVGDPVRADMDRACEAIEGAELTAYAVGEWLENQGIKLMPWQRKRLGLEPKT